MRTRALVSALLLPLALVWACQSVPPAHEAEQVEATAPETDKLEVVERTLAVAVAGQTLGTVETRLEKAADGTRTTRELVTFSVIREGGGDDAQFSSTSESVTVYDAKHQLVLDTEIEREAGITITRTVTIEGNELVSHYSGPGRPDDTKRFPLPADYRSPLEVDFELIAEWQQTGKPVTRKYSTFDASRERFSPTEVTLTGTTEYELGGEVIPAYVFRTVEEDGSVIDAITDHELTPLKVSAAGTFVATAVTEMPELGAAGRINAELPVAGRTNPDWRELARQELTVTVEGDDPNGTSLWENGHYHEVTREGTSYRITLLSTRPDQGFVAPKLPMSVSDPEVSRYLAPTAMAQSDDAKIVSRAKQIVGSERDALLAAARIVEAVYDGLDKQAGVRGSATATEVLQNGAGDCTEHAVLVVALMRAAGIPARVVDGIVMLSMPDGSGVAGYHAWAEIWLGQWIGVDATVNETGTSARYLQFGVDEPGMISSGGKMMRAIGKTAIELGPHKTYEQL
ncbi:MAG TPA: transglutaminase-like domain-containing protein, partial [Enhygromyxa sp.]|nr:transglutaminase-like domain-containing protein [Enhygromyxa sp.]